MRNKAKTFWFSMTVTACIVAIAVVPFFIAGCIAESEPIHYYKIQRLNLNGEVLQTYYSQSFPWGTDSYVTFREYPSNRYIKLSTSYTAEDLGINKPVIK